MKQAQWGKRLPYFILHVIIAISKINKSAVVISVLYTLTTDILLIAILYAITFY